MNYLSTISAPSLSPHNKQSSWKPSSSSCWAGCRVADWKWNWSNEAIWNISQLQPTHRDTGCNSTATCSTPWTESRKQRNRGGWRRVSLRTSIPATDTVHRGWLDTFSFYFEYCFYGVPNTFFAITFELHIVLTKFCPQNLSTHWGGLENDIFMSREGL